MKNFFVSCLYLSLLLVVQANQSYYPSGNDIPADQWIKDNPKKCIAVLALLASEVFNRWYRAEEARPEVDSHQAQGYFGESFSRRWLSKGRTLPFLWGVGTSACQVEGNSQDSTWGENSPYITQEFKRDYEALHGAPFQHPSQACDQVHRYKEDVQLIRNIGLNTYRFSIAWEKVQPTQDTWNMQAIAYYKNLCAELVANDIYPVITLHHYADPIWFAQKGGFSQQGNISYFVEFCKKMFIELKDSGVHLWFTFNSPSGYAYNVYESGRFPGMAPGERSSACMKHALENILLAHQQVYEAGKQINSSMQIGILKNIFQIEPWRILNPLDHLISVIANNKANKMLFKFFRTHTCLDFIGLNYYSHGYIDTFTLFSNLIRNAVHAYAPQYVNKVYNMIRYNASEIKTANSNYTIYGKGLYDAIKIIHDEIAQPCNIPIYITENGIAPVKEKNRINFDAQYLHAIHEAMKEGYDIRGYIRWSLMDNYEWGSLCDQKGKGVKPYGIYAVNFDSTSPDYLKRTLRSSASVFLKEVSEYNRGYNIVYKPAQSDGSSTSRPKRRAFEDIVGLLFALGLFAYIAR